MSKVTGSYKNDTDSSHAMSSPAENQISTKIHVKHLFPHFRKEDNVRITGEAGYDTQGFAVKLAEHGFVIEEVHMSVRNVTMDEVLSCKTEKDLVKKLADSMGLKGYRRVHAANALLHDPDKVHFPREKEFDLYIPIRLHFQMTRQEEILYICDHSQNKSLSEYELGLVIQKAWAFNADTSQKTMCWEHRRLFDASSAQSKVQELENKLAQIPEDTPPAEKLKMQKSIVLDHYKGKYQRLQRIFCGPNSDVLMDYFYRKVYGIKGDGVVMPKLTDKIITAIWELPREAFEAEWDSLVQKAMSMPEKEPDHSWSKKDWANKRKMYEPSSTLTTVLDAAVGGKQEAISQLEGILQRTVLFDQACAELGYDKVKELLLEAMKKAAA